MGWLSAGEAARQKGLSPSAMTRRLQKAAAGTPPGIRVAKDSDGRWWLHPDDLAKLPGRWKRAGETGVQWLAAPLEEVERRVAELEAALRERGPGGG